MSEIIHEIHYLVDQQASATTAIGINRKSYQCIEILDNGQTIKLFVDQAGHLMTALDFATKQRGLPVIHQDMEYPGKVLP